MLNSVTNIADYKNELKYDGQVTLATGKSRYEKNWKNKKIQWSTLVSKLASPIITPETYAEYMKMPKAEQDKVKDVGGYVGGSLKNGHRKAGNVIGRQILTLDLDFAPLDFFTPLELLSEYACCVYSTHKHSSKNPRFRLLIPLDREVSPDEYEAISRMIASDIGIDYFDDTTYQPSRLMYWPSHSSDGEYFYRHIDSPFMCADKVLARYDDWTDTSFWPESSRAAGIRKKMADKQGDPCEKKGLIGAFCRTYTVPEAIEKFIPGVYVQCEKEDRFTYAGGSTAAGLVIYEDGKFAYSNHGTDPASGKLCNAFDLVRIHKYGSQDEDIAPDTEVTKLPSYKAMTEMVQNDKGTKVLINKERKESAQLDFSSDNDDDWMTKLVIDKRGGIVPSLNNLDLILRCDENLKGVVYNAMADLMEVTDDLPWRKAGGTWRDADDAQLEIYLARIYAEFPKNKILSTMTKVADDRGYHPVKDFLDSLPEWDKKPRAEELLIEYLGANDNEYVRQVTFKTLLAAVRRIYEPGCKFDSMLVLCGPQGIGKSTIPMKLGGQWFSDALSLNDTKDKTAAEKLQGNWIMEIGELAGMRKTDIETLKAFIVSQNDKYRAAYGRRVMSHPRQSVFIGTTNATDGYLRDNTGNRRFWPVDVVGGKNKHPWDLTDYDIKQIWAEVTEAYKNGERDLYLSGEDVLREAELMQKKAMETDEREGMIREYLDTLLPSDWNDRNMAARRAFFGGSEFETRETGTVERTRVCVMEIWVECLGKNKGDLKRTDSFDITSIMTRIEEWDKFEGTKKFGIYGAAKGWYKR